MGVQSSKTHLLGYKSRDDAKREKYLQLGVESATESLSRVLCFLPFSSHSLSLLRCEGSPLCV